MKLEQALKLVRELVESYDHIGTGSGRHAERDDKEAREAMDVIDNAVLAERERCAQLCERWVMQVGYRGTENNRRYAGYTIGEPVTGLGNRFEGMGYAALIREGIEDDKSQ